MPSQGDNNGPQPHNNELDNDEVISSAPDIPTIGTKQIQAGDERDFKRDTEVQSHVQLNTAQVQLRQELDLQRGQVPSNIIVNHTPA